MQRFPSSNDEFLWHRLYVVNDLQNNPHVVIGCVCLQIPADRYVEAKIAGAACDDAGEPIEDELSYGRDGSDHPLVTYRINERDEEGTLFQQEITVTLFGDGKGFAVAGPYLIANRLGMIFVGIAATVTILAILFGVISLFR